MWPLTTRQRLPASKECSRNCQILRPPWRLVTGKVNARYLAQPWCIEHADNVYCHSHNCPCGPHVLSHGQSPCYSADQLFPAHLNGVTTKRVRLGETELIILEPGGGGSQIPSPPTAWQWCDSGQRYRIVDFIIGGGQPGEALFAAAMRGSVHGIRFLGR